MLGIGQRILKTANEFSLHLDSDSSSVSPANAKRGCLESIPAYSGVVAYSK